jgi:aspartate aminotransferase
MKWPAGRMASQATKSFGMVEVAARLQAEGIDVIHLEVGRPSADTPRHIKEGAKRALDLGIVHYGDLQGTRKLREALATKLHRDNGLPFGPDEILVTTGLTQASFAAFMAGLDPDDEVIVLEPYYPQHNSKISLVGGRVVSVPLRAQDGYRLDAGAVEAAITSRTTMIVLINPANPVGTVFSRDELQALADIALRHDLIVVSDEVYELIIYGDARHISIASLDGMAERTITLGAFTKAYAMDGWRLGYAAARPAFIRQMQRVTMNETTHPCVFVQEGGISALEGSKDCLREMLADDLRRRDLVVERLNRMPGVRCHVPDGTIYAFPDFSGLRLPSTELAHAILRHAHVAVEAGSFYGSSGEGHLRVCFGSEPYDRLAEAMDRIEAFCTARAAA